MGAAKKKSSRPLKRYTVTIELETTADERDLADMDTWQAPLWLSGDGDILLVSVEEIGESK
jgi:hypothetical protein